HEVAGQIKAVIMISKFADVSRLLWLKQVKESKIYKDLPSIGTWDKYCNYLGIDRSTTDEELLNLATFGEEFLRTVGNLRVGYRDLRKLRQLTHDGSVVIDAETITIGDKTIPFDQDHAEDMQAAIEWILDEKAAITQRVEKLEKDMNGIVKEETKGLKIEKDALLAEVKRLKVYDPEEKDRDWSIAMMNAVLQAAAGLEVTIQKFVIDPRMEGDRPLQAQVWAPLNAAISQLEDLDRRMRDTFFSNED
ncbi:MAG: hypothetical protein ACOYMG_26230, partial [Candidatus Methylumidiphilus sp.]